MLKINHTKLMKSIPKLFVYYYSRPSSGADTLVNHKSEVKGSVFKKFQKGLLKTHASDLLYLEVIGSGSRGVPKSLYVHTLNKKYIFNCGEGTRRILDEYKNRYFNVSEAFVTSNSWENVSGLLGLLEYTLFNTNNTFNIYGPDGLGRMIKSFNDLNSDLRNVRPVHLHKNEMKFEGSLSVQAIPLVPCDHLKESEQKENISLSSNQKWRNYILAYICRPIVSKEKAIGISSTLLPNRMKENIPSSPSNKNHIKPATSKDGTFIVLEIPNTDYLDSLINCDDFSSLQAGPNRRDENVPEVIVHFSPPEVMKDSRYRQWVESFSPTVSHLVINERNDCIGHVEFLKVQLLLNQFVPHVFLLPRDFTTVPLSANKESSSPAAQTHPLCTTSEYQFTGPTFQSLSLLQYHIRPLKQLNSIYCPTVNPKEIIENYLVNEYIRSCYEKLKKKMKATSRNANEHPIISFLGTASTYPKSLRNVSSILINADEKSNVLLDCGEGTLNQLVRLLCINEADCTLRRLKLIYISHYHSDHHLGLASILLARQEAFRKDSEKIGPLYILVPNQIFHHLKKVHQYSFPILNNVVLVDNAQLVQCNKSFRKDLYDQICEALNFKDIVLTYVPHVRNSFGISITHMQGWKITYSGDSMPSEELVKIGMNSDILIHEASFEHGLEDEANMKRHSSISQAIQIANEMKAKYTILTHFLLDFYEVPSVEGLSCNNVGLACDFMQVSMNDLPLLSLINPIIYHVLSNSPGPVVANPKK